MRRELVGKRLGDLGGEEAGVRVLEPLELRAHRRKHSGVPVPETGHGRTAARVEVAPPLGVDQVHALAAGRDRIGVAQIAVHDMSHWLTFADPLTRGSRVKRAGGLVF